MHIEGLKVKYVGDTDDIVTRDVYAEVDTDDGTCTKVRVFHPGSTAGPNLWDILSESQKDQIMDALQEEAERFESLEEDREADDSDEYDDISDPTEEELQGN